jgi:hypothetical protein
MYNNTITVSYNEDFGYREQLRRVFSMDVTGIEIQDDIDDVSKDEMIYDDKNVSIGLDFLYAKTKDVKVFHELYLVAASRMLSENTEIGIAVLFSYDYFALFHLCLVDFFNSNETITSDNENYVKLYKKIS